MPAPDNMTVHRTVRNDGQEYLDRLEIGKDVPNDIEDHLVNLYFTWQDPASHVVQREMYQKAKVQWCDHMVDNPYYSEALRNSICALGAAFESRHHPTFVTFPKSLADFFADRAKALLDIELDCPSVATVQAMVILSGHDIGCKRDARGWLYSGMAMRLAFDLALHVDMTPYVRTGSISQEEADLRKTVFWGAYTVDHQRALLCDIMAPLGHALYGSQRIPPSVLQEMNQKTVKELKEWKDCLPSVLQVQTDEKDTKTPYLPHVLLLHMHYHQAIIHAHRPWMSKHYIQPQPPQGPGHIHARKACVDSAVAIAKILQLYEERYTLKRRDVTTWEYS
ncbi:Nitrogen assimilation transcription factor nirA [Colletotrichum fructicola]|nr:Nitrogen assimilation transcription factor nirA [Colletotrichum fructicola]